MTSRPILLVALVSLLARARLPARTASRRLRKRLHHARCARHRGRTWTATAASRARTAGKTGTATAASTRCGWRASRTGARRPGVHDELEAVAVVFDDGDAARRHRRGRRGGPVAHASCESVRAAHQQRLGLDYLLVHSTHNHQGPDTQGIWGARYLSERRRRRLHGDAARAHGRGARGGGGRARAGAARGRRDHRARPAHRHRGHARPAGDRRRHPRGAAARGGRPRRARHARQLRQPRRAALGPQLPAHRRHRRLRAARARARARLRRRRCTSPGSAAPRSGSPATSAG